MVVQDLMTKEEINSKIERLELSLKSFNKAVWGFEKEEENELSNIGKEIFKDSLIFDDVEIVSRGHSNGSLEVVRPREDYKYSKGICEINVRQDWVGDNTYKRNIKLSSYSTSDSSDWELERLMVLGSVAKTLKENKEIFIKQIDEVKDRNKATAKKLYANKYSCENEIRDLKKGLREIEANEKYTKLRNEGLEFDDNKLGYIDVNVNRSISGIKHLQILSLTPSGLSATIRVKTVNQYYDYETKKYTPKLETLEFKNVRMKNINQCISYYS